ncbi:MAG TPA: hypothetical protein VFA70_05785, partial [Dehalococcoidia bacterium]|nr:hypothetical protein [Dehalococcoidia bacterium]
TVPVRVMVSYHGVTYAAFVGILTEAQQQTLWSQAEVTLQCYDAFELLRQANQPGMIGYGAGNERVDQAIQSILAAYGWTGGTLLDQGRTLSAFVPSGDVLSALQLAAQQELGGLLYLDKSGNVRFESRTYRPTAPLLVCLSSTRLAVAPEGIQIDLRATDLVSEVDLTYEDALYTNTSPPVQLYTLGSAVFLFTGDNVITGSYSSGSTLGAVSAITPVQNGNASTTSAWTGTNGIVLSSFASDAQGFKAVFTNPGVSGATLNTLVIRGQSVNGGAGNPIKTVPRSGVIVRNQPLALSRPFAPGPLSGGVYDVSTVQSYAQQQADAMARPHARPVVQLVGRSPGLIHTMLAAELSSRVILQDTGS